MTRVGVMQPYFLPHLGYFQLIGAVDTFVIYDDVNFIKGGWINRNLIQLGGEPHRVSLSLQGASPNRLINEIEILDDYRKLRKTVEMAYSKAPHFQEGFDLMGRILDYGVKNLAQFVGHSIQAVTDELQLETQIIYSSSLNYDRDPGGQNRLLALCESLGASSYVNSAGGRHLYNRQAFANHGIALSFLESHPPEYRQFTPEYVAGLSILDRLMFNTPQTVRGWMNSYELD